MKVTGWIAAIAVLLTAVGAQAQDRGFSITSGFVSKHNGGDYNERNRGFGLRMDDGKWAGWTAGYYRNSLDRDSLYVAKEWQWQMTGPLYAGAVVGAATGYRFAITPAVLPEVILRVDVLEVALIAQPLQLKQSPAFVALQVRLRF